MSDQESPFGDAAFPATVFKTDEKGLVFGIGTRGMTLRQWYAGLALQGDWATQNDYNGAYENSATDKVLDDRAKLFFRMADAMIKAGQ